MVIKGLNLQEIPKPIVLLGQVLDEQLSASCYLQQALGNSYSTWQRAQSFFKPPHLLSLSTELQPSPKFIWSLASILSTKDSRKQDSGCPLHNSNSIFHITSNIILFFFFLVGAQIHRIVYMFLIVGTATHSQLQYAWNEGKE